MTSDKRSVQYTYDAFGRLASATDGTGRSETFARDTLGRITNETQSVSGLSASLDRSFDAFGRSAGHRLEIGGDFAQSVCYTYGTDGRMDTITITNAQGRSVSVGYDRENGRSVGYAVRDSAGAPIFEQSFARDGWRPWLVTNATAGGAGVSQSTMKRTVFGIFLALNFPVFAEIDLPNQSNIPLRGSLGPNRKDAGNGRLSCSLVNETDRDWLVCVDESGEIVPNCVPEDARSSDIVEWTEIETFPNVFQRDGWHLESVSNRIP